MSAPVSTSQIDGCSCDEGPLSGSVVNMEPPLRMILSMEDTVKLVEKVTKQLSTGSYTSIQPSILSLVSSLKRHGPFLESRIGELLDRLQLVLRSACRDKKLDLVSRVHLLEIIELRSFNWVPSEHVTNYYKMKLSQINGEMLGGAKELPHNTAAPVAEHNKVPTSRLNANAHDLHLGTSHLLMNIPSHPTAQNFLSTRNLHQSPPIINLQKPPLGHRQSANHSGDNLGENPQHNTNPNVQAMKENIYTGSGDNNSQHTSTIRTKNGNITLTSLSKDLLHTVQHILQEELTDQILAKSRSTSTSSLTTDENRGTKPELIYQRTELLELATSPLCRLPPPDWDKIVKEVPSMVKIKPL